MTGKGHFIATSAVEADGVYGEEVFHSRGIREGAWAAK
jgi:hypothetical protein